jgi:acyl-coenzyme A synthetase/AMP-(fatty) acid ligase
MQRRVSAPEPGLEPGWAALQENTGVNFTRDVLERLPPGGRALVELSGDGARREWTFGEVAQRSARLAGALTRRGVRRGDVVMTVIGNRPEWVLTMLACFRIGAVALPCTEQLRAKDLRLRLEVARPRLVVADERNRAELQDALEGERLEPGARGDRARTGTHGGGEVDVALVPDESLFDAQPAAAVELAAEDPCLITFTSGTSGEPKAVLHGQRYLAGQRLQADAWLGARAGELVWCTASSGWSKSARNVFIAPWLSGAATLLHDARFDPAQRLQLLERELVNVLCMAPTEYRVIAKRATLRPLPSLRGMVAAGEALNPEVLRAWGEATGLGIRDGYGQTETGQLTGMPLGEPPRPGSMGRPLPGVALAVVDGELTADPGTVPTFFLGYLGEEVRRDEANGRGEAGRRGAAGAHGEREVRWRVADRRAGATWRTGDRVRCDDEGYLYFEGRSDDVIVSAGYRIGPFEVESALVAHPAVAEAAAVAAADEERGAVVRAVVVLRDGQDPSPALARELQEHVKRETAPYKYPRIVDFADELPKTASGKVRRALLRE